MFGSKCDVPFDPVSRLVMPSTVKFALAFVGLLEFDRVDATRTMVWKVYVAPEAQGRGIGGRLLERLLQIARTPEVRAEHDGRNVAAAALFDAFGFAVDAGDEGVSGGGARTVRRVRRLSPTNAPR